MVISSSSFVFPQASCIDNIKVYTIIILLILIHSLFQPIFTEHPIRQVERNITAVLRISWSSGEN